MDIKPLVYGRSLARVAGSNSDRNVVVNVVCRQVEVSATGRSPVQRSLTECGVNTVRSSSTVRGGHDPELGRRAT
jgi:hypothetical protein